MSASSVPLSSLRAGVAGLCAAAMGLCQKDLTAFLLQIELKQLMAFVNSLLYDEYCFARAPLASSSTQPASPALVTQCTPSMRCLAPRLKGPV